MGVLAPARGRGLEQRARDARARRPARDGPRAGRRGRRCSTSAHAACCGWGRRTPSRLVLRGRQALTCVGPRDLRPPQGAAPSGSRRPVRPGSTTCASSAGSPPTRSSAYERDLATLAAFAERDASAARRARPRPTLAEFVGSLRERGLSARSQARHVFSIRGFYALRAARGARGRATRPRTCARRGPFAALPRYLTPAAGRGAPRGAGRRERRWACATAPSSRCCTRPACAPPSSPRSTLEGVDLELGVVRVLGKGSKERLVPLGREARRWTRRYLDEARPGFAREASPRVVFLSQRGGRLSAMGLWGIVRRHAVAAGVERVLTPHVLRHSFATPPARARRRPAGAAGDARATPTSRPPRSTPT